MEMIYATLAVMLILIVLVNVKHWKWKKTASKEECREEEDSMSEW